MMDYKKELSQKITVSTSNLKVDLVILNRILNSTSSNCMILSKISRPWLLTDCLDEC